MAIPRNLANFATQLDVSGFKLGSAGTPSITFTGDTNTGIFSPGADTIAFAEGGAEAMRIDSSGRLLVGTTTARSDFFNTTTVVPRFQVELAASDNLNRFISVTSNNSDTGGGTLLLAKSRGTTVGAVTIVQNDDQIGSVSFQAADGVNLVEAARIEAKVDGSPGSDDMPGSLRFYTTADGAASTSERARITSAGALYIGTSSPPGGSKLAVLESTDSPVTSYFENTNASFSSIVMSVNATRNTTNGTYTFISCSISNVAQKFRVLDSGNVQNANNSYGSISDVKLKQDIVDAGSQWDDIKGLRVRKYRLKSEPEGFMQIGLVAQEAEEVSPGLVEEHHDYEEVEVPVLDDDGNAVLNEDGTPQVTKERNALGTTTKAIKYSVLYMKAVKALQEAMERIETLEAKVAALEAQ